MAQVHTVLARRADWLLVFDNVADPAAVQRVLPTAGGGRVLLTSHYPHWAGRPWKFQSWSGHDKRVRPRGRSRWVWCWLIRTES